jgi:hypothetical protein
MKAYNNEAQVAGLSVEDKLKALHKLQTVDSKIDKIKVLRGELPLEVQDLEDEIAGLKTRANNLEEEVKELEKSIGERRKEIEAAEALISRYKEQQNNVRNNREYDSLSKEIEFQGLEVELAQKKIKTANTEIEEKKKAIDSSKKELKERNNDLENKKKELEEIVSETEKEEKELINLSKEVEKIIESRLSNAYQKIRKNARNGLAVVPVERDACGGCFNKIPPQRQLDIRSRKKIIVCEHCGRILIDKEMAEENKTELGENK